MLYDEIEIRINKLENDIKDINLSKRLISDCLAQIRAYKEVLNLIDSNNYTIIEAEKKENESQGIFVCLENN